MSKEIPLTQGKVAIVDDEDYEFLLQWKWYAAKNGNTFYAQRAGKFHLIPSKPILMHRVIMNSPDNMEIDHINRNGIDNRKINLRIVSHRQNMQNTKLSDNRKSGHKGVYWNKRKQKWQAQIELNGKTVYLGLFDASREASIAYKCAEKKYFSSD